MVFIKIIFTFIFCLITSFSFGYTISDKGKKFIMEKENCVLTAYWDSNGYSIGWGHHGSDVKKNMKITKAQAIRYFNEDIKKIESAANRIIKSLPYKYKFSQGFFDGLCSLVYNAGEGGVMKSEFYKRLKNCRIKKFKININDFNFSVAGVKISRISAPGHKSRRYDEHKLMLN
jgi:GH24 family phage-related lysozyme (muramidase)